MITKKKIRRRDLYNNLTSNELKEWIKRNVEERLYFEIDNDQYFYFLMGQVTAFIINQTDNKNAASIVKNNIFLMQVISRD